MTARQNTLPSCPRANKKPPLRPATRKAARRLGKTRRANPAAGHGAASRPVSRKAACAPRPDGRQRGAGVIFFAHAAMAASFRAGQGQHLTPFSEAPPAKPHGGASGCAAAACLCAGIGARPRRGLLARAQTPQICFPPRRTRHTAACAASMPRVPAHPCALPASPHTPFSRHPSGDNLSLP